MISGETIICRKVRRISRYHVPNKLLSPEKFAYHVLLLFYPFRDGKELLSGFPLMHQNSQIKNDETPGTEYPSESDSKEGKTNKTSPIPNFMPQILLDDEIA